jgi:hypothetical protein
MTRPNDSASGATSRSGQNTKCQQRLSHDIDKRLKVLWRVEDGSPTDCSVEHMNKSIHREHFDDHESQLIPHELDFNTPVAWAGLLAGIVGGG